MSFKIVACGVLFVAFCLYGKGQAEMCAGCPIEVDGKDYLKLVSGTLNSLTTNSPNPLHLRRIVHASSQLVNGVIYKFDIELEGEKANCIETCRMEFYSQPWVSEVPQLTFENCTKTQDKARTSRQILGGLKDVEPSEMDDVQQLAEFAVSTLDEIDADDAKMSVAKILDAKKQLVNGILFHLELLVKTTSCTEGSEADNGCTEKEVAPRKHCKVQVLRSWADKSPLNAKVVKSECGITSRGRFMTGGIEPIVTNDDYVEKMANFALRYIDQMTNSIYVTGLVGVTKASRQVVAGTKVYLTMEVADTNCLKNSFQEGDKCTVPANSKQGLAICNVEIWEKPWEHFRKVLSANCKSPSIEHNLAQSRKKRATAGGVNELDPNSENVQDLTKFVLSTMDERTNSDYKFGAEVIKASSQVVAGLKMTIKMKIGPSDCRKGETTNSPCKPVKPNQECTVVVWDRPWLNKREILSQECHVLDNDLQRNARSVPGGVNEVDPNSEKVQDLTKFVLSTMDERTNSDYKFGGEVIKASSQVVAGLKMTITMKIGPSDCRKGETTNSPCKPVKPNQECTVVVWDRPWLNKREILSQECHVLDNDLQRNARSVPGGENEVDPNSEKVQDLTKFLLSTMDERTNSDFKFGGRVLKATSQVVAGLKMTITVEIGPSKCRKGEITNGPCEPTTTNQVCTVQIWDRPWLNKREITSQECYVKEARPKRSLIPGGAYNLDVNSDKVKSLIPFITETANARTNSDVVKVVKVLSATEQIVNGVKRTLVFVLGNTVCSKGENVDPVNCQLTGKEQTCHIVILSQGYGNHVDKFGCSPEEQFTFSEELRHAKNSKRGFEEHMPEGEEELDNNDPYMKEQKAFLEYEISKQIKSETLMKITFIRRATRQKTRGNMIRLSVVVSSTDCLIKDEKVPDQCTIDLKDVKECEIEVLDQPWIDLHEVAILKCQNKDLILSRNERSETTMDPDSPYIVNMSSVALKDIEHNNEGGYKLGIFRITHASKEVLQEGQVGTRVTLKLLIGPTNCKKWGNPRAICLVLRPTMDCFVNILDQQWKDPAYLIASSCEQIVDTTDDMHELHLNKSNANDYRQMELLKNFIADELTSRIHSFYKKAVVRVIRANSEKRVLGSFWRVTVEIGDTECLRSEKSPIPCKLSSDNPRDHQICDVVVSEQPWDDKLEMVESECFPIHKEKSDPEILENQLSLRRKRMAEALGSDMEDPQFESFIDFTVRFNRTYSGLEELKTRFRVFRANMRKVAYLQKTEQGTATYGITAFSDLTQKEFKERHLGFNPKLRSKVSGPRPMQQAVIPNITLPTEFDWRHYNAVTPVKNQGACGSCWAFSVTGNIEGQYAIKNGELLSLSEQELVDCDKYDSGCNGGLFDTAYHAIEELGGLETEDDYPYMAHNEKCFFNRSEIRVSITSSVNISKDETDMAKWLVANGPISVALNANAMQFYMGGVSHPLKFLCSPKDLDHGVLIVGYGVHNYPLFNKTLPYWTVKNSWGERWGIQGYYLLYRGDGSCGINEMAASAIL